MPAHSTFCQKVRKPSYFTTPPLHFTALHGGLGPLPPVRQARTHDIKRTMTQECNLIWCYQVSAQQRGERFQETIHMGGREILTKSLLFLFLTILLIIIIFILEFEIVGVSHVQFHGI